MNSLKMVQFGELRCSVHADDAGSDSSLYARYCAVRLALSYLAHYDTRPASSRLMSALQIDYTDYIDDGSLFMFTNMPP